MVSIKCAPYLFLYTKDLAKTRDFYERILGFSVIEEDEGCVKYDAGEIILALNRASDFGIKIGDKPDPAVLIVFHVKSVDEMRASLERLGVKFYGDTQRYSIGATAGFYDPDGHCLMIYEPSDEAMTWESATVIRRILSQDSRSKTMLRHLPRHTNKSAQKEAHAIRLGDCKLIYIFYFVVDAHRARKFFTSSLGLNPIEEDPVAGVAKYDLGGILVATHQVDTEENAQAEPEDLRRTRASALVFLTDSVENAVAQYESQGVTFESQPTTSEIGVTVRFCDSDRNAFFLYEPSDAAMSWPSGAKIEAIAQANP